MGKPFTVLVIGGGVGGLALGHALVSAGIDVQIHERTTGDDRGTDRRLSIDDIGGTALRACLPPALWDAFTATATTPHSGMAFRTEWLRDLVAAHRRRTGLSAGAYTISRAVLRTLLSTGLHGIVRYGTTFERYESNADGTVTAFFADGTNATGDVLVGADGTDSAVRRQYLPNAGRVRTDAISVVGRLPLTAENRRWLPGMLTEGMNSIIPSAGAFMFTSALTGARNADRDHLAAADLLRDDVGDYLSWAFIAHRRRIRGDVSTMDGSRLAALVGGMTLTWHPTVRRIVAETDPETIDAMRLQHAATDTRWAPSRITLLGDAIHDMPPVLNLGANVELRDAAELSAQLSRARAGALDLTAAIGAYEHRMWDYAFAAVRDATKYTELAISQNPVARRGMKAWLRICRTVPAIRHGQPVRAGVGQRQRELVGSPN